MAQSAIDREDYKHPEKSYKNLTYIESASNHALKAFFDPDETEFAPKIITAKVDEEMHHEEELCWSCGWTVGHQRYSSYGSRVRIMHTRKAKGLWEVGHRWIIRDQPNHASIGKDFVTQEFLRSQPNLGVPLIKEMRKLSAPTDKVDLTLMSRAQGVRLDTIWATLSQEQKASYTEQLGDAIKSWRQFTSPEPKTVDGDLPWDFYLGRCRFRRMPGCNRVGRTTDEWFENMDKELRLGLSKIHETLDPAVIEEKFQEMKRNFPSPEPYVLTHGSLNLRKIIVKDDKIEAIIGWDLAAYLPWWFERWTSVRNWDSMTDELFIPVWDKIGVEMDDDTFVREIFQKVGPVRRAWGKSSSQVKHHPQEDSDWQRPPFCECKPVYGGFLWDHLENEWDHQLKDDVVVPS